MLLKPYPGKPRWSEWAFQGLILVFFVMSILSMPFFNPTIRDYIFVEFKIRRTRANYVLVSMFPFVVGLLFCTFFPNVIAIWNFMGTTVYNLNGYIVPLMLKMNYRRQKSRPYLQYAFGIALCLLSMLFYLGYSIYELIKKWVIATP